MKREIEKRQGERKNENVEDMGRAIEEESKR